MSSDELSSSSLDAIDKVGIVNGARAPRDELGRAKLVLPRRDLEFGIVNGAPNGGPGGRYFFWASLDLSPDEPPSSSSTKAPQMAPTRGPISTGRSMRGRSGAPSLAVKARWVPGRILPRPQKSSAADDGAEDPLEGGGPDRVLAPGRLAAQDADQAADHRVGDRSQEPARDPQLERAGAERGPDDAALEKAQKKAPHGPTIAGENRARGGGATLSLKSSMRLPKLIDRTTAVLLHPTSLSGGDLGGSAREMVDFLAVAGCSWWQMLPVGPTGYGNSPYSAQSAFAGNPSLVSVEGLYADGLLTEGDCLQPPEARLRAAFDDAGGRPSGEHGLATEARDWLDDFALYRAIKAAPRAGAVDALAGAAARSRPRRAGAVPRRRTRASSTSSASSRRASSRDWRALRAYAHARGVALIGDLPIFLAHDSADVWLNRGQFHLDDGGRADAGRRRAARLLQRHRPALGQPALPLGRDARHRVRLVDRPLPRRRWRCSTPSASITSSATRATGRSRRREPTAVKGRWRPGPGRALLRGARRRARSSCRSSPRIWGWSRRRSSRCGRASASRASSSCSSPSGPTRRRRASCRTTTRARPSPTPARTTTTRPSGGSTTSASGTARGEQAALERRAALRYLGAPDGDAGRKIHWRMIRAIMASVANVAVDPGAGPPRPRLRGAHEPPGDADRELGVSPAARSA